MKKIYKTLYIECFDFNQNEDILTTSSIGSESWYNDDDQHDTDIFSE